MSVQEQAMKLPRVEKLRLMEALWADLSRPDEEFDSPTWHKSALEEAERQLASGKASVVDWENAKRQIRETE